MAEAFLCGFLSRLNKCRLSEVGSGAAVLSWLPRGRASCQDCLFCVTVSSGRRDGWLVGRVTLNSCRFRPSGRRSGVISRFLASPILRHIDSCAFLRSRPMEKRGHFENPEAYSFTVEDADPRGKKSNNFVSQEAETVKKITRDSKND